MTRYFVSPEESGQICLLACVLGNTGEIYFPKLKKEQVMTFSDMASRLLEDLGYEVERCNSDIDAINKSDDLLNGSKKYPVYYNVYGGPGSNMVEDNWGGSNTMYHQLLAKKGYIVFCVDPRGTMYRGAEFKKSTFLIISPFFSPA